MVAKCDSLNHTCLMKPAYIPDKLQAFLSILLTALASAIISVVVALPLGLWSQGFIWPSDDPWTSFLRGIMLVYLLVWIFSVPIKSLLLSSYCQKIYHLHVPFKTLFKINAFGLTLFLILQITANYFLFPVLLDSHNQSLSTTIELFLILFPLTALLVMIPLLQKALTIASSNPSDLEQAG